MEGNLYSFHTFIFPILWEGKYNDKENYDKFIAAFKANENWVDRTWTNSLSYMEENKEDRQRLYKESKYFHPYVSKAIYGYEDGPVQNFLFAPVQNNPEATYRIEKRDKIYELHINSIQMKIYNTRVALFIIECENRKHPSLEAVKDINDYGRRIYAPFVADSSNSIVADRLSVIINEEKRYEENFLFFSEDCIGETNISENFVHRILSDGNKEFKFIAEPAKQNNQLYVYPALDDRMFVMCAISDDKQTCRMLWERVDGLYQYERDTSIQKSLYELAFVDPSEGCSCHNETMRKEYLERSIYKRWLDRNSIYTVTYQAAIMLSGAPTEGAATYLYENFLTQYFQMLCICLAERASIIKFQRMTAECAIKEGREHGIKKKAIMELMDIQEKFAAFQGQLCFDEVTSQEQGVELWGMMKSALFVDKELAVLDNLIGKLYEIANTSLTYKINGIAIAFTFISALLALGAMVFDKLSVSDVIIVSNAKETLSWGTLFVLALVSLGIWIGVSLYLRRSPRK